MFLLDCSEYIERNNPKSRVTHKPEKWFSMSDYPTNQELGNGRDEVTVNLNPILRFLPLGILRDFRLTMSDPFGADGIGRLLYAHQKTR
jgi:hypothetical protein